MTEMMSCGANDKLSRIQRLKERKAAALEDNAREVVLERRQNRLKDQQAVINPDAEEHTKQSDDKAKILNYTIEQVEKWNETRTEAKGQGFQNNNQVAARTYKKELGALKVDKDSYKQSQTQDTGLRFDHVPSAEARKQLVDSLKENDDRKTKKRTRSDNDTSDSFINRKNKDFNKKLARQYKESE